MNGIVNKTNIEDMIHEVRGIPVMLDSDLAKLYHCKNGTKEVNQAVKNNISKFPEKYSWKLNDYESKNFLVKNFDQKIETRGGRFKNPRVFTEEGVIMLATILKSEIAVEMTIRIVEAFVAMRKYIGTNLLEQRYINNMVFEHDERIELLEKSFDKLEEKKLKNKIYFNGEIWDSYSRVLEILLLPLIFL